MAPARAAHAPSFTPLPDMSGGWPDVGLFPATPSQEVAGPYHPPRQSESYIFGGLDSVASLPASLHLREEEEVAGPHRPPRQSESYIFGGLAPVASLPSSLHGHTDWGQSAPEVTSSIRGWPAGASTSQSPSRPPVQSSRGRRAGRVAAQDAPGGASRPRAGATIRTAIVVEDAETDRPRKRARVGAAQRLGNSGWLSTGDIIDYTKVIAAEIAGKPGAERIGFADPSQIQLLLEGDEDAQAAVRHRLVDDGAPPILFVPVHGSGNHWSLLAIDRHANQAYHYDSMVPPDMAHWAPETEQFKQAKTVAGLLQVGTPVGAPIHQQTDGHSCGDHVLYGMTVLARQMLEAEHLSSIDLNLRHIEPDRRSVLGVLTWIEQFDARIEAAPAPQAPSGRDSFAHTETAVAPPQEPVWAPRSASE
ncbi:MAG: hypothetical protein JF606_23855 [Burkholderiales bacterium]|nr:hypothetical protein [Burkholderiales bacterium]